MSALVKTLMSRIKVCPYCRGSGYNPYGGQCDECAGTGEIYVDD